MTDWQLRKTKLVIPASLKTHRLTKVQKNAIYSDISDAKMQLDKDSLETVNKKCLCHTNLSSSPLIFPAAL